MHLVRRNFLLTACLLNFFLSAQSQPRSTRPDILIILTDDLGYNDVSYNGSKEVKTPNIDALCRAGMRFDRFYANSPVCAPTRASMMTGRYPDRVGVPGLIRSTPDNNWGFLDPTVKLMPARLKEAGYHTAHIGKWNLGFDAPNLPNQKGFDHYHGWLEDMMDDYLGHRRHGRNYMRLDSQVIDPPGHATDLFTQWSVDYIRQRAANPAPFLLYLAYNAPHFPVQPPAEWVERVKARLPGIGPKRAALIALIEHMDNGIGQVVSALKAAGRYDNTLIIFTGDNGGNLDDSADNRPLRNGKQSMYEGGLRVPTTATWPAVIKPGTSTQVPCMTMDILPTLIDITGKGGGGKLDGRSLLPLLKGDTTAPPERPLYFVRREGGMRHGGSAYHALRLGDWKMLRNTPYEPWQLYNLREDPAERNDHAASHPAILQRLNTVLMNFIQEGGRVPWQRPAD